jgi:hypothetical protein
MAPVGSYGGARERRPKPSSARHAFLAAAKLNGG